MNTNISSKRRSMLRSVGTSLCFAFSLTAAIAAPPATVPGAYGTVAIGDLSGMIDRVGTLASKVNPGMTGEALRGQLGMMLSDPGLSNLGKGSGLIAVYPTTGKPFLLIETTEGKAQGVSDTIKERGLQTDVVSSKLVAVAPDADGLTAAKGEMGKAAAAALEGSDDKSLLITVDADKLIQDKGDQLRSALNDITSKADEQKTSVPKSMFTFMGNMITAVGKRADVAQIRLDISGDGIQFDSTVFPVGGMTAGKPEGPSGEELLKSIPASGDVLARYQSYADTQSMIKAVGNVAVESLEGTDVSQADKDAINNLMNLAGEGFGDGMAGWTNVNADGTDGLYVISVANAEKANQYIEEGMKQIGGGPLSHMYSAIGLSTSATLTKNAGTVAGEPYHSFSVNMTPASGVSTAGAFGAFSKIKDGKYTIIGGNKMVVSLGDASLEEAVTAVKAGSASSAQTLKAASKLPSGGAFYADYDAGVLADMVKSQNEQAGSMMAGLKGNPILEAGYISEDSFKMTMLIPGELITKAIAGFTAVSSQPKSESGSDSSTAPSSSSSNE